MPSTVVHVALAGLLAAALLREEFDARAVLVVTGAVALIDLDAVVGVWVRGAHRAAFHTVLLPGVLAAALYADTRVRATSAVRRRWGRAGVRVAWVAVVSVLLAGIGPDLATNGVNVFWPLHDGFYVVDGKLWLTDQRGVVQTFVEFGQDPVGTTEDTFYRTGVDPSPGADEPNDERIFPIASSGMQVLLVVVGTATVAARLWMERGTVAESPDGAE